MKENNTFRSITIPPVEKKTGFLIGKYLKI